MNALSLKKGASRKSAYNLRPIYDDGTERHVLSVIVDNEAGDFIFIEPGVPHEVFNLSDTDEVVAIVARSDASEWENIVDYDRETESIITKRAASTEG